MMNKNELRDAFSKVQASDGLMQAVLLTEEKQKPRTNPWRTARRVAGCAAVLALLMGAMFFWPVEENYVTGPGLIKVYAYEMDETGNENVESVVLEEGVEFIPEYIFRTDTSHRPHFPMFFQFEHEQYSLDEIMLEVNTNSGIFYKYTPGDLSMIGKPPIEQLLYSHYGQHFTVRADTALYWMPDGFDYAYMKAEYEKGNTDLLQVYKEFGYNGNPSFFDIIIRANNRIIGYCVIEVIRTPTDISPYAHKFSFEVVSLVGFPKVDGKYQRVSEKYVKEQIQLVHDRA